MGLADPGTRWSQHMLLELLAVRGSLIIIRPYNLVKGLLAAP